MPWSQKGGKVSAYTIRSGNVTLNTKAGCVQSKRTSEKHCVNGVDRTIDVSSMCESVLKLHSKSEEHKQNSRCEQRVTLSSFGIFELHEGLITCTRYVKLSEKKALEKI